MNDANAVLFTDLYQLTMLQAYVAEGMDAPAVFDLAVRRLPPERNYLIAAGLDDALHFLETLRFGDDALRYLDSLGRFDSTFLDYLRDFRFRGTVHAAPEGTPLFADEPILEVEAPLPEAQLVETFLMNQVGFQTGAASKAVRVVSAARGRPVVDFGMRRMQGTDAAMKAARAFSIAGVGATSNMLAGRTYGMSVAGTMAHSYVIAHRDEYTAFRAFADMYPDTTLLVDTYDTLNGVRNVIRLAEELGGAFRVRGIRLDSGDLADLARTARDMLDAAGLHAVQIFASGGLDEYRIAAFGDAPIDAFGVGTNMGVSADAPALDIAYKLVSYKGEGRMKLSADKVTLPGRKQVFRAFADGQAVGDTIALADEQQDGEPLLTVVMRDGVRTTDAQNSLEDMRGRAQRAVAQLPAALHALAPADPPYPVRLSRELTQARDRLAAVLRG